jgi:hypothetical protein
MNIVSGSRLSWDGYFFKYVTNDCLIYKNDIFYVHALDRDGLYLLDLDCTDNTMYMWHCRLGHVGVKRTKKLQKDRLLESLDYDSLDMCETGLMWRKYALEENNKGFICIFYLVHNKFNIVL